LNPSYKLGKQVSTGEKTHISNNDFEKYLILRNIENISNSWYSQCKQWLMQYLDFVSWNIDEDKTLEYCKQLKDSLSITYYRKKIYQIRRFLEYLKVEWATSIKLPPEPEYYPKRIKEDDILETISFFKDHKFFKQIKAIILLGISSGMRAEEIYQLSTKDIDIDNRIIYINHNPENGQTTKTKRSRVTFFNDETQEALSDFLIFFNNGNGLKCLFTQSHISRIFRNSKLKVKDLRKFFSQEWDRRGGPTSIKKILMGHSLRNDVDLMHYNAQSEEDLKKIYDKVMS
jgi:integrase/recombinase XerD